MSMRTLDVVEARSKREEGARVTPSERAAMGAAIHAARRGIGTTHPNPRVGAVLVRGGSTLARGFHARPGGAHAEVRALEAAGPLAHGATLAVTLEPCAHHGKTPPCVDAILAAGVRRVLVGVTDPNPLVDGRGIERLREEGIEVVVGVRESECRALNAPYFKHAASGLPWVLLKSMVSLDGRMASETGESRGLGGDAELRLAHRLRAECDAVLVGLGTVRRDDPELTVRRVRGRNPWRVVLDSRLRLPLRSRLLATTKAAPLIVATCSRDGSRAAALERRGAVVWSFPPDPGGRVPLPALLKRLAENGRLALLVEGGSNVHTSFLKAGLADRVALGIAPLILGGRRAPTWAGDLGRGRIADAIAVGALRTRRVGRDLWLEADLKPSEDSRV